METGERGGVGRVGWEGGSGWGYGGTGVHLSLMAAAKSSRKKHSVSLGYYGMDVHWTC